MPTYEYECQRCSGVIERFQSITEKPLKKCSSCGGALKRLISAGAGFLFKGSGFYATDYRSDNYKKREREEKGAKEGAKPGTSSNGALGASGKSCGGNAKSCSTGG